MDSQERRRLFVSNTKAGAKTIALMSGLAQDGALGKRTTLRIALYLAQTGLSIFTIDTLRESGRTLGLNGAEMTANQQGDSYDAKATVCLQFVSALIRHREPTAFAASLRHMSEAGYSQAEVLEVMAQVSLSRLLCRMTAVAVPPGERVEHPGAALPFMIASQESSSR